MGYRRVTEARMPRLATFQVPVVQPAGAGDCPCDELAALGDK